MKTMWESCVKLSAEIQTNAEGSQRFQVLGQIKIQNRHFIESVDIITEKEKQCFSTYKIYDFLFRYKNATLDLSDVTLYNRQFYQGIISVGLNYKKNVKKISFFNQNGNTLGLATL